MKYLKYISAILLGSLMITSCTKDDPKKEEEHHHEHGELPVVAITLKRTDLNGENPVNYKFNKKDPSATKKITLKEGTEYNFEITDVEVQHEDHTHHILGGIIDDKDDYFFVYGAELTSKVGSSEEAHLHFHRMDKAQTTRKDGKKLGIFTEIEGHGEGSGKLTITLKHEAKNVDDTANHNLGSADGEDEIVAVFPLEIVE